MGVGGSATISCKLTAEGRLSNCAVLEETPPNAGFGAAAVSLAPDFRMTPTGAGGKSVEGVTMVIPLHFQPPTDP